MWIADFHVLQFKDDLSTSGKSQMRKMQMPYVTLFLFAGSLPMPVEASREWTKLVLRKSSAH